MNTIKRERQSNIEVLRIFSIIGVIVLHYNNRLYGNAFGITDNIVINHFALILLESLCICSVNVFIIISAYYLSKSNRRNIIRIVDLFIQVIVFSVVKYLISARANITLKGLICSCIPNNYFVTLYATLYIISPLINTFLDFPKIDKKKVVIITSIAFL